jgi:hypothetical protein
MAAADVMGLLFRNTAIDHAAHLAGYAYGALHPWLDEQFRKHVQPVLLQSVWIPIRRGVQSFMRAIWGRSER